MRVSCQVRVRLGPISVIPMSHSSLTLISTLTSVTSQHKTIIAGHLPLVFAPTRTKLLLKKFILQQGLKKHKQQELLLETKTSFTKKAHTTLTLSAQMILSLSCKDLPASWKAYAGN